MKAFRTSTDQTARVGTNIRFFRQLRGMSQEKLGQLSGAERSYVGKIERGENNPTVAKAADIAKALGIPTCLLYYHLQEPADGNHGLPAEHFDVLKHMAADRRDGDGTDAADSEVTFVVTVRGDEAFWEPLTPANATKVMTTALQMIDGVSGQSGEASRAVSHVDITEAVTGKRDGAQADGRRKHTSL